MQTLRRLPARARRAAFTLLEMMVVIMIIGILSTYLVVSVPGFIDKAQMTASERNMSNIFMHLQAYQGDHNSSWPPNSGQRFFLRPWKDGMIEKTEKEAKIYFSPKWTFEDCMVDQGYEDGDITIVEYLDDWEAIGEAYTSYAGFNTSGDRELRRRLKTHPGSTTIVSDARWIHQSAFIYLTADGTTHRLLKADALDITGMTDDELYELFEPGPGCEVEELQTVTND